MKKQLLTLLFFATYAFAFSAVQVNYMYIRFAGCDNRGAIAVFGSGGNGTYTYKWSNGRTAGPAAADSITNLQAGTYWVTCYSGADSAKDNFRIYEFSVDTIYRFHACHGGYGRIYISGIEASWPVHTQWYLNGDSLMHDEFEPDSLHGGLYTLYLVDAKGCELRDTIKIGESSPVFNVYTNDTVVCYNESGTFWFTPGFTLIYEDYFYGSSNDTFYPFNTLWNGIDVPYCAMDSEGCIACDDTLPEVAVFSHPSMVNLYKRGDTISIGPINLSYDAYYTYGWSKPFSYEVTHYNFYVVDTPGNYHVSRQRFGCVTEYGNIDAEITAIKDITENGQDILVNPNPAKDEVTVTLPSSCIGKTLRLYDLYGRLLTENIIQHPTSTLQLQIYPAGIYFVKIGKHIERLVKQ